MTAPTTGITTLLPNRKISTAYFDLYKTNRLYFTVQAVIWTWTEDSTSADYKRIRLKMKENSVFWNGTFREQEIRTVVVGTGAAGYHAALRLHRFGEKNLAIVTEDVNAGTSRNTGSDKQTYYKLSLAGPDADSVTGMASDLFRGQCVDGDLALCEAALSARCFYHLMEIGVPFPDNIYGECMGYKTDHDRGRRASSVGPYTSKIMTECQNSCERRTGLRNSVSG